ncbi:hypothetical protein QQF64_025919 [Cirrhinus molitorella]|uniref:Uncharacterized protein n=1 Tax=Cirrhinus molitorella TaxID=172907 RepID=A0ABR3NRL0_9TELE
MTCVCVLETRGGFCLIKDGDEVILDRSHGYYYQVQAQLHITDYEYCDFVVWNCKDIFVERISPDMGFWDDVIPKLRFFQKTVSFQKFWDSK